MAADLASGEVDAALRLYGEEALHYQIEAQPQPHPSSEISHAISFQRTLGGGQEYLDNRRIKDDMPPSLQDAQFKSHRGKSDQWPERRGG